MICLSVNVNKVATLRNARGGDRPDVVQAATEAVRAGADGITVHPRPDERHIRRGDVLELAEALAVELNIEGYPTAEWLDLVEQVVPAQATLVPDPPDVLTSNAGWDLSGDTTRLREIIGRLRERAIRVSLFLDPDPAQVERAAELGADRIELYTEEYARQYGGPGLPETFSRYRTAAEKARECGLGLNAGHDLNLDNLPFLARHLPGLAEVSIGHALISDALYLGLAATVRAYKTALKASETANG